MKKYEISLPNGRKIKYRVAKETSNWILLETIVDAEILAYLNHFAKDVSEVEGKEETTAKSETVSSPEVTETETKAPAAGFSEKQIADMKDIKAKMKLDGNDSLNPFVSEWSYAQGKDWSYLNANNVDNFVSFMRENYLVAE